MTSGFEMSSDVMSENATRVRANGEDYAAAMQRLSERGAGGGAWGDDGLLGLFTSAYAECTRMGVEALTGLADTIGTTGDSLNTVASRSRAAEEVSLGDTGKLHGEAWG
ncbi:hypothetical protein [Streptosporangium sp. KLBMP 9127]|nr:hypothetical protein [Streptosporangium sp. KLBMP 9127]